MFEIEVTYRDGKPVEKLTCTSAYCELGRARNGLVRLRGWKVAAVHARIEQECPQVKHVTVHVNPIGPE